MLLLLLELLLCKLSDEHGGTERLRNLPKGTQLVHGQGEIQTG